MARSPGKAALHMFQSSSFTHDTHTQEMFSDSQGRPQGPGLSEAIYKNI